MRRQQADDVADGKQGVGDTELVVLEHIHPDQHGGKRADAGSRELPGGEDGLEIGPGPGEVPEKFHGDFQEALRRHQQDGLNDDKDDEN